MIRFNKSSAGSNAEENEQKELPRRESLGNIQNFLKTLAYWKKTPSHHSSNNVANKNENARPKVERSKSFSIKCDKGYSTYYQIEPKKKTSTFDTSFASMHTNEQPHQLNNNYKNPYGDFHQVGLPLPPINPVARR